jgi:predicted ATPase/DNA-binding winged helix-turn-helix (wHTH) protein
MVAGADLPASVGFGRFRVLPHRGELLADGQPAKLGARGFDILMALIEARGEVVSKNVLMARVWPGRIVEENNLQSQISALRVALGPDRDLIRTVSGRGYQFIGEIRALPEGDVERGSLGPYTAEPGALSSTNIPEPVSELIGRRDELEELVNLMGAHRLVTLTGAGGIGKTRLAVATARELLPRFADGVWLAQLSPLTDPTLVPAAVASALGLELGAGEVSARRVAQILAARRLLLVLDTCEHVIDAAAEMAEAVLQIGLTVRVIATSREPLRVEGERLYLVPPLDVPPQDAETTYVVSQYGAVRLFVERAREAGLRFASDQETERIASLCRRLDGIPLALELAAARAATLGVEVLATAIDDCFGLITGGRRTALPRHQTLRATLDWSHDLLRNPERVLLRRLAVFAGAFSLRAVSAVATSPELTPSQVIDGLVSLVAKSLVMMEAESTPTRYRLLDTTRAYALEKLDESDERISVARRHAKYYLDVFEQAEAEWNTRPPAEWLADYSPRIDNLRVALDWSFSPGGEVAVGVSLAAAALPLWMHLSLLRECHRRAEQALTAISGGAVQDALREMKLHCAVGTSLTYIRGAAVPEVGAAWVKAFKIAESLTDIEYQLRSLWGIWAFHLNAGRQRIALESARKFCSLAARGSEPFDRLMGERMLGISEHHMGEHRSAQRHLEGVVAAYATSDHRHTVRFQLDVRVTARTFLARSLWLQGLTDQATRALDASFEDARVANHANSLGYALGFGTCLIMLMVGDLDSAERYIGILVGHSTRYGLPIWLAFGHSYQGMLCIQRGRFDIGLPMLRAGLDELGDGTTTARFIASQMAEILGRVGRIGEGLATIEQAIGHSVRDEERWATAELLRIKGELLILQSGTAAAAAAADHFQKALNLGRRQGALYWELRAATSFARLLRNQGRIDKARSLLQPVYGRFTEGFDTSDAKAARGLLNEDKVGSR